MRAARLASTVARRALPTPAVPSSALLRPQVALAAAAAARRAFSAASGSGPALVLADHDNQTLADATLNAVTAASQCGGSEVAVLVLGSGEGGAKVAEQATKVAGVSRVLFVDQPAFAHALAEHSSAVAAVAKAQKATHVLAPTSATGKNILPRLGAHLDVQPITEVIEIQSADTFVRPVYAGNAVATVQSSDAVKVLTVRPTSFPKAAVGAGQAKVEKVTAEVPAGATSEWQKDELTKSARPELASARIVVAGGRGLKSKENFVLIEQLADALGGAVGASRAAVDAGYVPNDAQVGQTGKVVAPDLYVAVGISGAIQHLAGMKDSKTIVAINKDKEAPIFQIADYALEADLFKALPEMTKLVAEAKAK